MVYPHEHVLLRFNGWFASSIAPGIDQWSCSVRMGLPAAAPAFDPAKLQTLVNSAHTAAKALHGATGMGTGTQCYYAQATGAQVGVSGKYTPASQQTTFSPLEPTAGIGTGTQPWSAALVYSLRTTSPRGRASNGRVYWPAVALAIDANTGRVSSAGVTSRLNGFKTFINALNTAGSTYSAGMAVIVASNVGGGLIQTVTSVRSDARMDSIERRENNQPASWTSVTIP